MSVCRVSLDEVQLFVVDLCVPFNDGAGPGTPEAVTFFLGLSVLVCW